MGTDSCTAGGGVGVPASVNEFERVRDDGSAVEEGLHIVFF